jgi:tetratricopeptide (TPR) repeat protein
MSDPGELRDKALAALKARDRSGCIAALKELMALPASAQAPWLGLARIADALQACDLTVALSTRALERSPGQLQDQLTHLGLLAKCGRIEDALAQAVAFKRKQGNHPALNHLIGVLAGQMGETDTSIAAFRSVLSQAPQSGASWVSLVAQKSIDGADSDYKALQAMRSSFAAQPPENRASLLYAIAKCQHDCGAYDAAFRDYAEGAAIMRSLRPYRHETAAELAGQVINEFSQAGTGLKPSGCSTDRPIFVTGLPRSGTTLVEQILASHPAVSGGAELNLFTAALAPVGQLTMDAARRFEAANPNGWTEVGDAYLELLNSRFGTEGRIVDKTLAIAPMVGLLRHVMPNAPVVWLRRAPEDAALSCFRTWFNQGMEWSWSLEDIAEKFRAEDRLYHHWAGLYGPALLTVDYETLIAEPTAQIARILAHCKLSPHAGLEDFHKTRRAVTTASQTQVRQALHAGSIDSAQHYHEQMSAFRTAYQA